MSTEKPTNPYAEWTGMRYQLTTREAFIWDECAAAYEKVIDAELDAARTEGERTGREEEATRYRKLVEAVRSTLDEAHPLRYGFERLPDGREVMTTNLSPRPELVRGEVYDRCHTCEQWSPCDVRAALSDLESP